MMLRVRLRLSRHRPPAADFVREPLAARRSEQPARREPAEFGHHRLSARRRLHHCGRCEPRCSGQAQARALRRHRWMLSDRTWAPVLAASRQVPPGQPPMLKPKPRPRARFLQAR